jgi:glycosyltransferase involved in cell wall biosynthesis
MKVSVIIPSYKDILLNKTVQSLLDNSELGDQLEVICVMDGYWQQPLDDPRVKVVHLGRNRGMRDAINAGVSIAKGDFLLRMDEHQIVGQGYDRILIETCQPNWIVTPRRFFLDVDKWEVMDLPPIETLKLSIKGGKFTGENWPERNEQFKDEPLVETMAMQGSMWLMPHKWWDEVIGELQTEGYGPLNFDSHEMVFKTWQAGGKLMLNKNTWHAHKHRSFKRTHRSGSPENPKNEAQCYEYSLKIWSDYYKNEIRPKWKI